jgi:hypothetical protein
MFFRKKQKNKRKNTMFKKILMDMLLRFDNFKILLFLALFMVWCPIEARSDIIWSGDYETGNFNQWHLKSGPPNFHLIPEYGRPPEGGGDGSLLEMVTNPVRQGKYAAKFTVKNSKNGYEPDDCDVPYSNPNCTKRRTEVTMAANLSDAYNGLPHMSERWLSVSHFIPMDWDSQILKGFGPIIFQVNARNSSGSSPAIEVSLRSYGWQITHRFDENQTQPIGQVPWQQQSLYSAIRPGDYYDHRDLLGDFPDREVSERALASVNKGGWTDWIFHVKFDERGPKKGGTGFLRLWKREANGDWIEILHIKPKTINVQGINYERGIGYNVPSSTNNGGYGIVAGLYMQKEQAWDSTRNRVIYNDNIKVGNEKTSFNMMSPDGSSPNELSLSYQPPKNLRPE